MKKILIAVALAAAACAPDLVAEHPGAGGPCDPLYRVQGAGAASCRGDLRLGYVAREGQAIPRPEELVRIDRETLFTAEQRLPR